VVEQAYLEIAE